MFLKIKLHNTVRNVYNRTKHIITTTYWAVILRQNIWI